MTQQTSPFLDVKYGWNYGESGWNTGMDENLVKFSFLFDRNIDAIVSSLPNAVSGQSYFLTSDNRLYFSISGNWYSSPTPKWFEMNIKSTGQKYHFNGTGIVEVLSPGGVEASLDAIELRLSQLGTASNQSVEFFASKAQLDVAVSNAAAYTDTLKSSLANTTDLTKGISLVGGAGRVVNAVSEIRNVPKTSTKTVFATAFDTSSPLGGGNYILDLADTTTADDNWSVLVNPADGGRWKLSFTANNLNVFQAGAKNGVNSTAQMNAAAAALYNKFGGGNLYHSGVMRFDSQLLLYPGVTLVGSGQQSSSLEYYGPSNSIAIATIRPAGYAPTMCTNPGIHNTSLIRRSGSIFDGTIGLDINLCKFGSFKNLYMALWDRAITHNATNSSRGTLVFDFSQQDFWNTIEQVEFNSCRYGQTYYGASNRNTSSTNTYSSCTACHDFSNQYNTSETNLYLQENYEGCNDWALWRMAAEAFIYTQTWIQCTFENPSTNGFAARFYDPGHQVFVNMSLIPPNNPSAVYTQQVYPGIYSTWMGTGTGDRYTDFGFRITEQPWFFKVAKHGPQVRASTTYTGTVPANGSVTTSITLAGTLVNDVAEAYFMRDTGCIAKGVAVNGAINVRIFNPTASPITITAIEIVGMIISRTIP